MLRYPLSGNRLKRKEGIVMDNIIESVGTLLKERGVLFEKAEKEYRAEAYDKALEDYRKCYETGCVYFGEAADVSINSLRRIADCLFSLDEYETAGRYYRKCFAVNLLAKGDDSLSSALLYSAAESEYNAGDYEKALEDYKECGKRQCEASGKVEYGSLDTISAIARTLSALDDYAGALEAYEVARNARLEFDNAETPSSIADLYGMAEAEYNMGYFQKAYDDYSKCHELRCSLLGDDNPARLMPLMGRAKSLKALGNVREALPVLEKCYEEMLEVFGEYDANTQECKNEISHALIILSRE